MLENRQNICFISVKMLKFCLHSPPQVVLPTTFSSLFPSSCNSTHSLTFPTSPTAVLGQKLEEDDMKLDE